jgi:fimbrial isopeptide formation D2 family protein
MQAGEIRTLTYNVMLDPSKTRLYAGKYGTLFENSAVLSSKGIERQTAVSDFKELSSLSPYKYVANYTLDDDGIGGTITYAIKLVAPSTNTVPLDNAKLYDFIRSASNQVSYVEDSMYLYTGNQITDNNYTNSYGVAQNQIYKVYPTSDTINDSNYSPKFTLNIGNFAPGTTKWLYYQVHVDESMYLNQNGGKFTIQNRVQTYDKNDVIGTDSPIEGCNKDLDITFTEWEHKYDATKVTKNQTISVSGNVYNSSKQSTSDTSFEVKSGDYEYNVVVNKAGITNIDNADLNDKLSSNLDYVGYLRIDTYCGGLSSGIETEVSNHTYPSTGDNPTQTVWLEVNGSESFSFKPSELGISDTCSIVLTYYVRPTFTNGLFMNIQNDFSITGSIGSGSTYYNISPGTVYVKMQIQQETSCNVTKDFWYYVRAGATDDPETLPTTWDKGAMYWILKVSGTNIPANTAFRDKVMDSYEGTTYKKQEIVKDSSFIGVYIVPKDNKYLSLSDLNEAVENNQATEISSSDYDLAWGEDKKSVDVKFKNNVAIEENKEVYIIVKTKLLEFKIKDENYVYANAAYEKFDGDTDFLLTATPTEYKFQNKKYIAKDITAVFDYDGNGGYSDTYVTAYGHNSSTAFTYKNQNLLKDAGTYIEYTINACIAGTANGDDVIFYDTLPEGLELAYVRNVRFQDGTANNVEMSESELSDKSPWVSNKVGNYPNFTCVDATGTTQQCIYYYNASTREVRWKVDNVNISTTQSGGFSNALTFQLVCKVVDEQVLMGVKDLKVVNSIDEYQYGALVDSTSADAYTFKHKTIDKTPGELNGKTIPFTITVNSTGIDILKDKNTIVLVDEMSSTLKIDDTSIQITDLSTNTLITNYTVAVVEGSNGTTLVKFTIPDNKKLKITYNAKINALSNHTATITNKAYWEGYSSDSGTTVTREVTFTISGSGSITEGATPTINIKKVASNDITTVLEGAEFKLEEVTYNEETQQYSPVSSEFSITETTNREGKIVFNDPNLQFDTIYRLTETKAPEGYQLNNRTYYVILINDSKIDYSKYADFEYYKYEEKEQSIDIEITDEPIPSYSLPSAGGIGTKPFKVIGVVFLSGAVIGYAIKRRRRTDF